MTTPEKEDMTSEQVSFELKAHMTGSQSATIAIMQKALQASPISQKSEGNNAVGEGLIQEVEPMILAA